MAKTIINREELGKVESILDQELVKAKGEIGVGDAVYLEELLSEIRDMCDQGLQLQNLKAKQGEYKFCVDMLEQEFQLKLKKKKKKFEERMRMRREKEKHREEKEKCEEERSLLKAKYEAMRWTT